MSPRRLELSEGEYLDIEEALAANARGRAFLRMRDQRSRLVGVAEVRRLVRELKDALPTIGAAAIEKQDDAHVHILREELKQMSAYINQTRREIAALRPADAGANRIMAATGELDAIVSATERATSDILNGAERIQQLAAKLPRDGETGKIVEEIQTQVTEVLTACSFQDITGQRTTKVVNTLRYIEQRVNSMIGMWGIEEGGPSLPANPLDTRPDAHLMNGPAADGGPSQDDVDALFERLDQATTPSIPAAAGAGVTSTQNEIDALFGPTH
ncbi:MAG TPA: protein phosphatase CheZ [Stellaceae bacterium]|nr:protein phosphatase CheZ [Stellaceae bacterium]